MDNLDKIKKKIEEIQSKSAVTTEMRAFITLVLSVITKSKEELTQLSQENIKIVKDSVLYIEHNYNKQVNTLKDEKKSMVGQMEANFALLKGMIDKVKTIKPIDGIDGLNGTNGKNGIDGKEGSPDNRLIIVTKINSGKDKDLKIEAKQITGLPEFTREVVREVGSVGHIETPLKAGTNITITTDGTGAKVINASGGDLSSYVPYTNGTQTLVFLAGTTAIAPFQLQAGTNLTIPVAGTFEFDGTDFWVTI